MRRIPFRPHGQRAPRSDATSGDFGGRGRSRLSRGRRTPFLLVGTLSQLHVAIPLDAALKALAAMICASFALIIFAARPRSPPTYLLSLFLLLIAGNQASETLRALAVDDGNRFFWFRIATVFGALDPFVLAWSMSHMHFGERLKRGPLVPFLLTVAAAFALYAGFRMTEIPATNSLFSLLLAAYSAITYGALALLAVPAAIAAQPRVDMLLFPALLAVALPATPNLSEPMLTLLRPLPPASSHASVLLLDAVFASVLVIAAVVAARSQGPILPLARRRFMLSLGLALGLWFLLIAYHWGRVLIPASAEPLVILGRSGAPIKWLLFSAVISVVLFRAPDAGFTLRWRRRAARLVLGMTVLGAGGVAFALAGVVLHPLLALLVIIAAGLSQGFRRLVDHVASRVYRVPSLADAAGRHEAYRLGAASVLRAGGVPARDPELARLREELDLDEVTARTIEQLADDHSGEPLVTGRILRGRYRVKRLIGRGGAGRAFLAEDLVLEREVALKEVYHEQDALASLDEARAIGAIAHPHVLRVYDVLERPGSTILITEYAPGGSLADHVAQRGPLQHGEGLSLLRALLSGLATVHASGIVHRDLKPSNVLLDAAGAPKLADFGIAIRRPLHTTVRAHAPFERAIGGGTPGFMAPEHERGEPLTPAADIYAVARLVRMTIAHPLPPPLEGVIERALESDASSRWRNGGEMLSALEELPPLAT